MTQTRSKHKKGKSNTNDINKNSKAKLAQSSKKPKHLPDISFKKSIKDTNKFIPDSYSTFLYMIHLKLKYDNFEMLLSDDYTLMNNWVFLLGKRYKLQNNGFMWCSKKGIYLNDMKREINIKLIQKHIKKLQKAYLKNNKNRFIIIPLTIKFSGSGHANVLIIDFKKNVAEYFEPHGSIYSQKYKKHSKVKSKNKNSESLLKIGYNCYKRCESILSDLNIKIILPLEYMNYKSFQSLEYNSYLFGLINFTEQRTGDLNGYCQVWTLWFISMRLKYPDRDTKKLVSELESIIKTHTTFRKFIRNYSKHCYTVTESIDKKYNTDKKLLSLVKDKFTVYKKQTKTIKKN